MDNNKGRLPDGFAKGFIETDLKRLMNDLRHMGFPNELAWKLLNAQVAMIKPPGYCGVCDIQMNACGATDKFPDCNCWCCSKCGNIEPETGSQVDA